MVRSRSRIERRSVLAGLGVAALGISPARAQGALPVVGFLNANNSPESGMPYLAGLRRGLSAAGYDEGRNVTIETRYALGQVDRLPGLADELVRLKPAALVASGGAAATFALKNATTTIPILGFPFGDAVKQGLIVSINHPGGNFTGVTFVALELDAKRIELLDQVLPHDAAISYLLNAQDPEAAAQAAVAETAARKIGRRLTVARVGGDADLEPAFAAMSARRDGGLAVSANAFFNARRARVIALAAQHALPAIYEFREFAHEGGLMSYGADLVAAYDLLGHFAARILGGEKPADMPVEQLTKYDLVINLKTAKALGITFPLPILGRADEVIE